MKTNFKTSYILGTAFAGYLLLTHGASAQILNGSFESADLGSGGLPSYESPTATDWTLTGSAIVEQTTASDITGGNPNYLVGADTGNNALVFNAGGGAIGGTASQSFATVIGQQYSLDFAFGQYGPTNAGGPAGLGVSVGDLATNVSDGVGSSYELSGGLGEVFSAYHFTFTATGLLSTLTFTDTSSNVASIDTALDSVSVSAITVPEPSSTAMVALGLGVFAFAMRSRALRSKV